MSRPVYATIKDLRDEGLSSSIYPDARALVLLERAATTVERLTKQTFGPKREHFYRDGRNGRIVLHPKGNKVIEVESLSLVLPDHTRFTLSPQTYVVYDRFVRLRRGETGLPSERAVKDGGEAWTLNNYSKTRREITLPDELHNTEVWGTFGYIEPSYVRTQEDVNMGGLIVASSKELTGLVANMNKGDTVIKLADTGTIAVEDVIHIDPKGANFWVIVGGVFHWVDATLEDLVNGATQVRIVNIGAATVGDVVTLSDGTTSVTVTVTSIDVMNSRIQFAAVVLTATIVSGASAKAAPLPFVLTQYDTLTTAPLIPGGTYASLLDVSSIEIGDELTINDGNTQTTIEVSAIDTVNKTVTFPNAVFINYNALSPGNISAGAQVHGIRTNQTPGVVMIDPSPSSAFTGSEVIRWGRFPRDLKEAVVRTALASKAGWSDSNIGGQFALKRERTDNYEYEKFPGIKVANIAAGTGDPIADNILSGLRAPPFASYV